MPLPVRVCVYVQEGGGIRMQHLCSCAVGEWSHTHFLFELLLCDEPIIDGRSISEVAETVWIVDELLSAPQLQQQRYVKFTSPTSFLINISSSVPAIIITIIIVMVVVTVQLQPAVCPSV